MIVVTTEQLEITYDEFVEIFEPIQNDDNRPIDIGFYFPKKNKPWNPLSKDFIWTLLSDDNGDPVICSGAHYVNRLEYYLCKYPVPQGIEFYEIYED